MKGKFLKLLISIIIMVMLVPLIPNFSNASETYIADGVTATLSEDGTLTISGEGRITKFLLQKYIDNGNKNNAEKVVINNGITSIDNWAFEYWFNITSVTIPNSVTSIGRRCVLWM